jgi:surface antigen
MRHANRITQDHSSNLTGHRQILIRGMAAVATIAALATGMLIGANPAGASQAASGPYLTVASPSLNERTAPSTSATIVGSLPYHTTIYINCQTSGSLVGQSTVWDQLTSGAYVSDYWTNTPGIDTWTAGIPRCGGTGGYPYPQGASYSSNPFPGGQCTWGAEYEWHAHFGSYIKVSGDAHSWAASAAANGWTVMSSPAAPIANGSLAVFQAGVDGASSPYGHVAWVVAVSGSTFEIYEMNGTAGPYHWDYRWVNNVSGVSFIYW